MRFSLQDVKKSVQRRGGELAVSLHFLLPGELAQEIDSLIAYHEARLGQAQREFSLDEARACVGDYRLAHCLLATLSAWYNWRTREWDEVLQERALPELQDIASPIQLRLALYSFVNEHYQGFLSAEQRAEALERFASLYELRAADLEYLLQLDSEDEALLVRTSPERPAAQEVATLYNQWTFEVALCNASSVHFLLDCQAFVQAQAAVAQSAFAVESGLGAAIKRLCYLARKLGVYYDLLYEESEGWQLMPSQLHLTLYGPQDVTGAPQQYGLRLARLCRLLLGYDSRKTERSGRAQRRKVLGSAIVEADATVHFLQRAYHFEMDAHLLSLLPSQTEQRTAGSSEAQDDFYDSSIEQQFAEGFQSLAQRAGVDGWQLEREPEPLLLKESIFIPDFALKRGEQRIYVEILGFWTPSYRERKIQKLQQLQHRKDLLLIIPSDARQAFAAIAEHFPIVYYDQQISLSELLRILRTYYDDFAQRVERIEREAVRAQVRQLGLIQESACYELLHCYRRSELQQAVALVKDEEITFLPGLGLYTLSWMQQLKQQSLEMLAAGESQGMSSVLTRVRHACPILANCEDAVLEIVLEQWPELLIQRDSIFEARVNLSPLVLSVLPEGAPGMAKIATDKEENEKRATEKEEVRIEEEQPLEQREKKPLKEKRIAARKRVEKREGQTRQEDLWSW